MGTIRMLQWLEMALAKSAVQTRRCRPVPFRLPFRARPTAHTEDISTTLVQRRVIYRVANIGMETHLLHLRRRHHLQYLLVNS